MDDQEAASSEGAPRRPLAVRLLPLIIIVSLIAVAFAVMSRPTPGSRTVTDTSVRAVIGMGESKTKAQYPIGLQEGGDPAHEADHVLEPLQGVAGISAATLDWSNGVVLIVEFDSAVISSSEVANLLAQAGYLKAP